MSRKNYTEREKRELLTVVEKYKSILENKSTNAVSVEKKNETWEKVALEFNAGAEFPRTAKQLNTAYQNLKRLTRQKVSEENMKNYNLKKEDLNKFKTDDAKDKKQVKATGGGSYTPALSEVGAQMLALMGDQLTPLSNTCDSASEYYKINEDIANDAVIDTSPMPVLEYDTVQVDFIEKVDEPKEPVPNALLRKRRLGPRKPPNLRRKIDSSMEIKRKFYKKKLECALIEKKIKMANYKLALKNQKLVDLEIKIKELQYSALLGNQSTA